MVEYVKLIADFNRLSQVLGNFLSNATKVCVLMVEVVMSHVICTSYAHCGV
jgi:signal transduction histidine kinase